MRRPESEVRAAPHYVYWLLGKRGAVLYIGCSLRPHERAAEHCRGSFGERVGKVRIDGPYDFVTARAIEKAAIQQHQPRHNIEHTARERRGMRLGTNRRTR